MKTTVNMDRTVFEIPKMDCASEEQLIRMKLEAILDVEHMEFDIPGRMLTVLHRGKTDIIENAIIDLNLGGKRLETLRACLTNYARKLFSGTSWLTLY